MAIVTGWIFIWFNLNGLIRHFARNVFAPDSALLSSIVSVSFLPRHLLGNSADALYFWMVVCFFGTWLYLGTVLLLALARVRPAIAGYGIGGFFAGGLAPALLCWAVLLVGFVLWGVGFLFRFIGSIVAAIVGFIVKALLFAAPVLIPLAVIAVVVWIWKVHGPKLLLFGTAGGVVAGLVIYYLLPVLEYILEKILIVFAWIGKVLAFLFGWLPVVLMWLAKALVVLLGITSIIGIIGCVGQILVDQLKTALEAGRSQKGVLAASFSLGVSFAMILLVAAGSPETTAVAQVSVVAPAQHETTRRPPMLAKKRRRRSRPVHQPPIAPKPVQVVTPPPPVEPSMAETIDRAWARSTFIFESASPSRMFLATLPAAVADSARDSFRTASAPMFDAAMLAVVLALSFIGLLRGVFSRSELEYRMRFYNSDLLKLAVIPFLVVLLLLSASEANQE